MLSPFSFMSIRSYQTHIVFYSLGSILIKRHEVVFVHLYVFSGPSRHLRVDLDRSWRLTTVLGVTTGLPATEGGVNTSWLCDDCSLNSFRPLPLARGVSALLSAR